MADQNPFLDDVGCPYLRPSIVAFVDLLGYRSFSASFPSPDKFVRALRDTLSQSFAHLDPTRGQWEGEPLPWMTKTFTDNIVVGYPIVLRDGEAELSVVLGRLSSFQLEMTLAGFFMRGGVAVGDLYMDENIVFGPALVEAYEAEQSTARDPRIVLAPSATRAARTHLNRYVNPAHSWVPYELLIDSDGEIFLNYLYGVVEFEDDVGYPHVEFLERHRDVVVERLRSFRGNPRVWAKYFWAARYHNYFCDQRDEFREYRIDLEDCSPRPARLP